MKVWKQYISWKAHCSVIQRGFLPYRMYYDINRMMMNQYVDFTEMTEILNARYRNTQKLIR